MRCVVPNCRNSSIRRSKRDPDQQQPVSFFQFPKSPELFNRWLSFCRGSENALKVKNPCICIEHFRDEDIEGSIKFEMGLAKKRTLRPGAVPCINKSQESPSEIARLERSKRRSNHKLVADLLLEDEARASAPAEVVPTPSYVRLNTGIASAPSFVSPKPAEEELTSIIVEDDPLVTAEKAKLTERCRTCYKEFVVDANAKDLFDPANSVLIFHIEVISGVWIKNIEGEPHLICPACQMSLQLAIEFREMCIGIELKLTQPKLEIDEEPDLESVQEESLELDIFSGSEYSNLDEYPPDEPVVDEPLSNTDLKLESVAESLELGSHDPLSVAPGASIVKDLISQYTGKSTNKSKKEAFDANATEPKRTTVDHAEKPLKKSNPKTKEERNLIRRAQIRARPTNFVCDQCGQAFRMAHNLQIHILRHTRTKNYQCNECPMTFYDAYMRNIHIRIKHRGETPFSCRYCKATFAYAGARQKHESGVHGAPPRRIVKRINPQPMPRSKTRYHCELCEKHYASKYALAWHVKSHTDAGAYKCQLCDKSYSDPATLKRHEITHDDKRPLQCEVCLKGFYQQTKLREHELIHTGERPYRCEICDVHFRYKYNMKVHANSKMHQENLSKAQANQIVEI
ncbi:zinc finger protein 2 [Drosophila serrata]|uniref:zinc finger protein 2 n=1 Tax=Drosophila serrata TaxID=7274 RepID=UPI000A1D206B|nr:zinc finger protein 2 [Drosophila serrata]